MKTSIIALKPYLDIIKGHCELLSNKELNDVIIGLAKGVTTKERVAFLEKFESNLPDRGRRSKVQPKASKIERILNDIEALKESIAERIESIEDGSYWDNPDAWDHDGYYDEDPEYFDDDHTHELDSYFVIANSLFMDDNLKDARKVYAALFSMINETSENERFSPGFEMDIRESRARYCRCVYETSDKAKRLDEFSSAMEIDVFSPYDVNEYDESYPLFQDVIDARPNAMVDMKSFLPAWKKELSKKGTYARPAVLLLESVHHLEGVKGVSKLAKKWKNNQPQGYVFWLDILKTENDQKGIIKIGTEGLKTLKEGRFRERVAKFMIDAAGKLHDDKQLLLGKRERFFSLMSDQNLLDLMDEAIKQDLRDKELGKAICYFKSRKLKDVDQKVLFVKTLLMAGQLDAAFAMAKNEKSVGWSYHSSAGLVFGSALSVLSGHSEKTVTIKTLLRGYANQRSVYSGIFSIDNEAGTSFFEEIISGLKQKKFSKSKKVEYLAWAEKIGKSRIEHIVSNKHRRAYERAAQVLGSLAEAYVAIGQKKKTAKILHRYYSEKYSRFSAFRRDVKAVVLGSDLLKNSGFLP